VLEKSSGFQRIGEHDIDGFFQQKAFQARVHSLQSKKDYQVLFIGYSCPVDALDRADINGSLLDLLLGGAVWVVTLGFSVVGQAEYAWNIGNTESATGTFILINPWCLCHFHFPLSKNCTS
jgi:hypothetical protein